MDILLLGTLTISAAGLLNGTFVFPMKLVRGWNWENIWLLFAVFGLILLPGAVAFTTVDGLIQIYRSVPASSVFTALLLGFGWGVGSLLFGLGVAALGFSLGYVVVMGTTAVIGTIIPALLVNPAAFASERGLRLLGSLLLIVLGLFSVQHCRQASRAERGTAHRKLSRSHADHLLSRHRDLSRKWCAFSVLQYRLCADQRDSGCGSNRRRYTWKRQLQRMGIDHGGRLRPERHLLRPPLVEEKIISPV